MVISLLLNLKAIADPFYMDGTSPRNLMDLGFKLFSVEPIAGGEHGSRRVVYTFVKDESIVSCRVLLEVQQKKDALVTKKDHRLYEPNACYFITTEDQSSYYETGSN